MRRSILAVLIMAAAGCAAIEIERAESAPKRSLIELYFPSSEGSVWSYDVDTGEALKSLVITRVVMRQGSHVAINNSGAEPIFYELREEGIFHLASGSYLLKLPFEVGESWRSRDGIARIVRVNERVEIDDARYAPCVIVEESRAGSGARVETSYCEGIGVTRIETSLEGGPHPRPTIATLRGFQIAD